MDTSSPQYILFYRYGINLPPSLQSEDIKHIVTHVDFCKSTVEDSKGRVPPVSVKVPLYHVASEKLVKIVAIGCRNWSLTSSTTSVALVIPGAPITRKLGFLECNYSFLPASHSDKPDILFNTKNNFSVRNLFPDLSADNCHIGATPKTNKSGEIIGRYLPIGKDENDAYICPLGYLTYTTLLAREVPHELVPVGKDDCIERTEQDYLKDLEIFKEELRDWRLAIDLKTFVIEFIPSKTNVSFSGSAVFDVFYTNV